MGVIFYVNLSLFVNSATILLKSDGVNNDWHEAVVDSAKLTTLAVESSGTIKTKTNLVQAPRYGVHFNP